MKVQDIVTDVRSRFGSSGKQYQHAFRACVDAQKKALGVMGKNGQTLANTEIGAAKNLFAAARASFDKARVDGVRKVARNPQTYVPNGRAQIVSAYKDSIRLLVKTGNELTDVVSSGYKSVLGTLNGDPAQTSASGGKKPTASKTAADKTSPTKSTASRKKTASRSNTTTTSSGAPAAKRATASKSAAGGQKKTTANKRSTTQSASASSDSNSTS